MTITKKVTRRNVGEIDAAGVMIDITTSGHTILVCIDGEAFAFSAYHAREIAAYLIKAADEVQS